MRKNKMMRAASGVLVATLMTTSIISGTFAKYTTSATGKDSARVATWGFADTSSITLDELFKTAYDQNVLGKADVIAPGTTNSADFYFKYSGKEAAPEVAYTFKVDATGSKCADEIQNNKNIQWKLDNGEYGTWSQLITAIENLDGNKTDDKYEANTLPDKFNSNQKHTISWKWDFDTAQTYDDGKSQDEHDTAMGNKASLDDVTIKITITATQID